MGDKAEPQGTIPIAYINLSSKMSGAEFSLLRLMRGLDQRKFHPVLLLPEPGPFQDQAEKLGIETVILAQLIKFGEHFHWYKIPKACLAVCRLRRIIRAKKILLVHGNSPRAAYIGGLAARLSGVPSLTHVRDIQQSPFASPLKSRLLGFISNRIIAVSKATADAILKVNPGLSDKTEVIYNGFDIAMFASVPRRDIRAEWAIPPMAKIIGCVGMIHPNKGQDILVRAVARLKASIPSIKLLLIGEVFHQNAQAYKNRLEKLAAELGIKQDVVFTGFREDVLTLVCGLDVFVHPAVFPDPLPGALIEAAALGKAIVAARVGGVAEIVEHEESALLLEAGDVDSLVAALLDLLEDPGKSQRLGRQARTRTAALFAIENYVQGVSSVYERLLEGKI